MKVHRTSTLYALNNEVPNTINMPGAQQRRATYEIQLMRHKASISHKVKRIVAEVSGGHPRGLGTAAPYIAMAGQQ